MSIFSSETVLSAAGSCNMTKQRSAAVRKRKEAEAAAKAVNPQLPARKRSRKNAVGPAVKAEPADEAPPTPQALPGLPLPNRMDSSPAPVIAEVPAQAQAADQQPQHTNRRPGEPDSSGREARQTDTAYQAAHQSDYLPSNGNLQPITPQPVQHQEGRQQPAAAVSIKVEEPEPEHEQLSIGQAAAPSAGAARRRSGRSSRLQAVSQTEDSGHDGGVQQQVLPAELGRIKEALTVSRGLQPLVQH